ncbi:hypothetical protein SAMN05444972_1053 [Marininema halotolerans]|uniref:Uncharacterized protein n=1 Tax=Marininema halotolerans TaxID=1155944 RepID=A0A1I6RCT3_9BACL|nr:hypothetical protein SAMN05444972_1053 [Marininema halotolerans]
MHNYFNVAPFSHLLPIIEVSVSYVNRNLYDLYSIRFIELFPGFLIDYRINKPPILVVYSLHDWYNGITNASDGRGPVVTPFMKGGAAYTGEDRVDPHPVTWFVRNLAIR